MRRFLYICLSASSQSFMSSLMLATKAHVFALRLQERPSAIGC